MKYYFVWPTSHILQYITLVRIQQINIPVKKCLVVFISLPQSFPVFTSKQPHGITVIWV